MDTNKMCEANRIAWNEAVPILNKNSNINIKELIKNNDYYFLDKAEIKKFKDLSLANKNIAQLCCNNGREVISLVKLGASLGVGFDISDEAIAEAKELAQLAKMNCIFERTNVYDISEKYNNFFDIVYFSAGCFNWIEDLNKLFKVVSRILKSHGKLVIYEMHPVANMFMSYDDARFSDDESNRVYNNYFNNKPHEHNKGIDYISNSVYKSSTMYEFQHTLSDIINNVIRNGIVLISFDEFKNDVSAVFRQLEKKENVPLSFMLIGEKQ
ncbi:MAG: hypothetical protein A2Y24_07190 [Clostridiales bacterium GWE2_32_10]|nr:MAG: hypothetical protein A2Y24_07190 [Clostridiales bacterium GWE2_32_10]